MLLGRLVVIAITARQKVMLCLLLGKERAQSGRALLGIILIYWLQKEKEALSIELQEKLKENREKYKKFDSDTIKEVELIIYRSELSEEFKKKLINTLPEAIGLLG